MNHWLYHLNVCHIFCDLCSPNYFLTSIHWPIDPQTGKTPTPLACFKISFLAISGRLVNSSTMTLWHLVCHALNASRPGKKHIWYGTDTTGKKLLNYSGDALSSVRKSCIQTVNFKVSYFGVWCSYYEQNTLRRQKKPSFLPGETSFIPHNIKFK